MKGLVTSLLVPNSHAIYAVLSQCADHIHAYCITFTCSFTSHESC